MSSELTFDLIYTILYSITAKTVGKSKGPDAAYEEYDFTNVNEV